MEQDGNEQRVDVSRGTKRPFPLATIGRVEQDGSQLKCRFTPVAVGSHTMIGKDCVVEAAGIGCNVRIEDGCILVSYAITGRSIER